MFAFKGRRGLTSSDSRSVRRCDEGRSRDPSFLAHLENPLPPRRELVPSRGAAEGTECSRRRRRHLLISGSSYDFWEGMGRSRLPRRSFSSPRISSTHVSPVPVRHLVQARSLCLTLQKALTTRESSRGKPPSFLSSLSVRASAEGEVFLPRVRSSRMV